MFYGPSNPVRVSFDSAQLAAAQGQPRGGTAPASGFSGGFFAPGEPPHPTTIERPRVYDYAPGQNLHITPRVAEPFSFANLRAFANQELVRLAIETRKDQLDRLDWQVKPKDSRLKSHKPDERVRRIEALLRRPDGDLHFSAWTRVLIEDLLVLDAPAIERVRNRRGEIVGYSPVPGDTIKLLVDETGRKPRAPLPAYQQIIKGRVWADLTTQDLIYAPRNIRSGHIYGFGPVEQVIVTINMALERQASQLAWFTAGTMPRGFATVPDTWSPDQIKDWQKWFTAMLEGNAAARAQVMWAPGGSIFKTVKDPPIKDDFDEWLARIICFAFSLPPTAFIKQMNRSTAEQDAERGLAEGLLPLMLWVKRLMDQIIQDDLGYYDLEFSWKVEKEVDPKTKSEINATLIRTGQRSINEVRGEDGVDPIEGGDEPVFLLAAGPVPVARGVQTYHETQDHAAVVRDKQVEQMDAETEAMHAEAAARDADEPDGEQDDPTARAISKADFWGDPGQDHGSECACGTCGDHEQMAGHTSRIADPAEQGLTKADAVAVARRAATEHIDAAAAQAEADPTPGRKKAGNYRKGHVTVHGLDITIESRKGSKRKGQGRDGKPWAVTMPAHYGYVKRTLGADGDHVDVYLGPDPLSRTVFVIDQVNADTRRFDEHKVMLGFRDAAQAALTYVKGFSDGRGEDRLGRMTPMTLARFKKWLAEGDTSAPLGKAARADRKRSRAPAAAPGAAPAEEVEQANGPFDQPATRRAMARVEKTVAACLADGAERVATQVVDLLADDTLKAASGDDLAKDVAGKLAAWASRVSDAVKLDWLTDMVEDVAGELAGVARAAADAVLDKAGVRSAAERRAAHNRAAEWARARAAELVGRRIDPETGKLIANPRAEMAISDAMRAKIRSEIAAGLDARLSPEQIGRRIAKLGNFSKARARMIARTEVARARNAAVLDSGRAVQALGRTVLLKSWITADNPCPVCVDNAGESAQPLDAVFGSGHSAPPAHPNCMCALEVTEVKPETDEPRPTRGLGSRVRKP